METVDILILSNGPGELTTWVLPVVKALRENSDSDRQKIRISLILSPCPHATGKEAAIARSHGQIDRVQEASNFLPFLLMGKTAENWDWRKRGVVLFLGGDQFFAVVIGKRLGYRTIIYAEWEARWHSLIDRFAVMKSEIIPKKYADKFTVVGDLMAVRADLATDLETDVTDRLLVCGTDKLELIPTDNLSATSASKSSTNIELIGLLVGSKPAKLAQGVPLFLAIAEYIYTKRPQTRFIIPVAPTLDLETLAKFANLAQNPVIKLVEGTTANLIISEAPELPFLITSSGLCVQLWTEIPAYNLLSQCRICITTVGANTAELGSLAVPMLVLLPTQQLDAMRSWDGLPGILANLPGIGSIFAKLINGFVLRQGKLFAWPNIWANKEIVPELVGKLQVSEVGELTLDYLQNPDKLQAMRDRLRNVRGQPGAAEKLATIVYEEIANC